MRKYCIVVVSLFIQLNLNAQKNFTIVYQTTLQSYDSVKYSGYAPFHLVIQDSFSYCYTPSITEDTNVKRSVTLGSAYRAKSTFYDFRKKIKILQEGFRNKPKTHKLAVSKAETGKWAIKKGEEKIICGYRCVKATGVIDQRTKIVWFSPNLPSGFGPYFIHSLPGTVLESYDESGYYATASEVRKEALPIIEPNFCKRVKRHF